VFNCVRKLSELVDAAYIGGFLADSIVEVGGMFGEPCFDQTSKVVMIGVGFGDDGNVAVINNLYFTSGHPGFEGEADVVAGAYLAALVESVDGVEEFFVDYEAVGGEGGPFGWSEFAVVDGKVPA